MKKKMTAILCLLILAGCLCGCGKKKETAVQTTYTSEELQVYRRGRNAKVNSVPQHADAAQYHAATGLECLFGWLYLGGAQARITELFNTIMEEEDAS